MKRTAGFLKFLCTFTLVFEAIAAVSMLIAACALLFMGNFSELTNVPGNMITVDSTNLTPEQLDAMKPVMLVTVVFFLASILLALYGTLKTRTALDECKNERPFSQLCVDSLKTSARMEIISGIVGILASIVISVVSAPIRVNGASVGSSMGTLNLTWLLYAVEKYLLYHVAEYGRSLENRG